MHWNQMRKSKVFILKIISGMLIIMDIWLLMKHLKVLLTGIIGLKDCQ